MYIKGLVDRLVCFFYMRFVLSANRANDPSNTAFWIDIGTEHFPPHWLLGVSKHPRVCKHRPDPT